ncbi:UNVERIFIED_CONTAM: histidyl-tRNA synthetase [Brevibacillus sp. OAP136]
MALEKQGIALPVETGIDCFIVVQTEQAKATAFKLLDQLRQAGVTAEMDYLGRKMKAQLKASDRLQAKFTAIIGESELANGTVVLKEMATGEQRELPLGELAGAIRK